MTKPQVLQLGPYPDWDQGPLNQAFEIHRYFDATDKTAFMAQIGPRIQAKIGRASCRERV